MTEDKKAHSTAIEGSTVTEVENQLLFDEGISAKGRSMVEQLMNLDLKAAYEASMKLAKAHTPFSIDMLKSLSALVMKNTGSAFSTLQGSFDSSKGDFRLVNVTAGTGGKSYVNFMKVPSRLEEFCKPVLFSMILLLRSLREVAPFSISSSPPSLISMAPHYHSQHLRFLVAETLVLTILKHKQTIPIILRHLYGYVMRRAHGYRPSSPCTRGTPHPLT